MQKEVTYHGKKFHIFIDQAAIQREIQRLADQISRDYRDKEPLFLAVLNGAFMFAANLLQRLQIDCEISFIKLNSYSGMNSSGEVKSLIGLNEKLEGRDLIILEDIVDTGVTLDRLKHSLAEHSPSSVRIATLLLKPEAMVHDFKVDYVGMEVPNEFLIGYGLDYDGYGRQLPAIYKLAQRVSAK